MENEALTGTCSNRRVRVVGPGSVPWPSSSEVSLGQDFRAAVINGNMELKNATVDAFCMDRTLVA